MTHPIISMSFEIAKAIPRDVPARDINIVAFAATLYAIRNLPQTRDGDKR